MKTANLFQSANFTDESTNHEGCKSSRLANLASLDATPPVRDELQTVHGSRTEKADAFPFRLQVQHDVLTHEAFWIS